MNCEQFSQQLGANPRDINIDMTEHVRACGACAQLLQELVQFDATLEAALDIDVPEHLGLGKEHRENVVALPGRPAIALAVKRPQRWAVAAVVMLGIGISLGTWYGRVTAPLPQSLVRHVRHEPKLLTEDWKVVPVAEVEQVLQKGRVSLNGDIGTVRHAGLCSFRGNRVAHVVVQTASGPVTVMLLPEESLQSAQSFDEDGLKGVMIPIGNGSIAVIGDDSEALSQVRQRVTGNVAWSI